MKHARSSKSKPAKKSAKKSTASSSAKTKKPTPAKAGPLKLVKPKEEKKKISPEVMNQAKKHLQNPVEKFFEIWKAKAEPFEVGLQKFLDFLKIPDKESASVLPSLVDKLQSYMRKETLPAAIEEQLMERYPRERIHKMTSILSMKPKTHLRLNFHRADVRGFGESQAAKDLKIKRSTLAPWAFEIGKPEDLSTHAIFQKHLVSIQDEAAQILPILTNARPGQRILDLVSNQGDTALSVAAMMKQKGSLFVYDSDPRKLKLFKESAQRQGIENFRVLTDSQIPEVKSLDIVLVDAPCTGLGQLALRPELKWRFSKEDLPKIHKLQAALLREGARKLKLGGHLIYTTNTLNKSENEMQIENFLKSSHNSYRLIPFGEYFNQSIVPYAANFFHFSWDAKMTAIISESDPYLVLSPDVFGSSGLFVAILQRTRISS